ncbi:hypothetical protein EVA_19024 [gut metagenome]|uniref:Uncharacterized protein n=1 Tax=gut metagenome TaxID=749906 RepID=J9BZ64_9ZZZZ
MHKRIQGVKASRYIGQGVFATLWQLQRKRNAGDETKAPASFDSIY